MSLGTSIRNYKPYQEPLLPARPGERLERGPGGIVYSWMPNDEEVTVNGANSTEPRYLSIGLDWVVPAIARAANGAIERYWANKAPSQDVAYELEYVADFPVTVGAEKTRAWPVRTLVVLGSTMLHAVRAVRGHYADMDEFGGRSARIPASTEAQAQAADALSPTGTVQEV